MIAVCAVAFATVAQAVAIDWTVGELLAPGENGGWGASAISGDGYLTTLLVSDSYSGTAGSYALGTPLTFTSGDSTQMADNGWVNSFTSDSIDAGPTYYAQIIVTKGDYTLTSQIVSFNTAPAETTKILMFGPSEIANISALSGESFSPTYGAFSKDGWQSVPEPTSGLLLLLGVAGLALKRKRA